MSGMSHDAGPGSRPGTTQEPAVIRRLLVPAVLAAAFLATTPANAGPCRLDQCPVVKDVCPEGVCAEFWDCLPALRCG